MAKLRLLIKQSVRANTCIPVIVDSTDMIGTYISSLVDYLGLPTQDVLGRVLTYSLRPLSGGQPLSNTMRFADAQVLPETRLVLEEGKAYVMTQPIAASLLEGGSVHAKPPPNPLSQFVNRRTFVVGSVLTSCAVSGLLTGIATAFATRRPALPIAMTAVPLPGILKPALLFSNHQQTVRAVAWSPDGTRVASGAGDGWLLLWTPNGQVQQRISHPAGVTALAWEPSGRLLASGSGRSVRFFEGHAATLLAPARSVHTRQVTSLAWSGAVGHPLVSGSLDRRAIVWETQTFQPQAVFTRHTAAINALSCQSNSPTVTSASQGGVVRVWDVGTLAELHGYYQDAPIPMRAAAFAPMGNQLAVGADDGQVRLWNDGLVCQQSAVSSQGTSCVDVPLRFRAQTAPVRSVSWSPDARFLATGGEDGTFAIWAFPQDRRPTLVAKTSYADPVEAITWSPVREQVAAASGTTVTIWNIGM